MTLQQQHLETILAVIEEGTFESAAKRLHITASAVSQRVKALEDSIGQVLLQRSTPARATDAGELVVRHARQVQLLAFDLDRRLAKSAEAPTLAIAVNADSLVTWFLSALAEAHQSIGVTFDIHREDQALTASLLRSGAVMAAVTSEGRPVQGCLTTPLGLMRYRAVSTPEYRDRWCADGDLAGLVDAPMVQFDRNDDLQLAFLRSKVGRVAAPPRHFVPSSADFATAVFLGMGWAMLPDLQSSAHLEDGRLVELAPDDPAFVSLYWQRWNIDSPVLDELSTIVVAAASRALER